MSFSPTQRSFWVSLALTLMLFLALTACSEPSESTLPSEPSPPTATPEPPTATPLPRGGTLNVGLAADVPDLRPWQPRSRGEEQISAMLYSGLMRLDDQLQPVPDLAEEWATTPDGRTLTFTLRSDLQWHDGTPLDAADVLFTLERLRALPPTSTALLADLRYISGAVAHDGTTVVFTLTSRFAPLLAALSVPILPSHLLADQEFDSLNFWDIPVGSGPFRLSEAQPGQAYQFERFEQYHHGAPLLDQVRFVVSTDAQATMAALGDTSLLLAELPWSSHEPAPPNVRVASYPENGYYFLGFNLRPERPFADPLLRQALALAIDQPRLVEAATKGQGIPISSSALPGSWADMTRTIAPGADLDAARALLDEAGWQLPAGATIREQDGITLTASLYVRADDERRLLAARQIAEVGASIGMQIQVEPGDFDTVILARYAPPFAFDLLLGSWLNGAGDPNFGDVAYYDPDDFALFHSSQLNQGPADSRATRNVVGYNSPEYDAHAQVARQLYNISERRAAISQAQAQLAADLPYLFLWADRMPVLLNERVVSLDGPVALDSPRYYWNIERWYLE
ncbi:peptide ABC transporter substrate-binding protein [Candidatus Viridilinea mediisalina]|uniref:ABC transporter substrate-binding protein n=1 Tax=Candidatus Viridilinea mediisalina TaxID=2024553 RepID=A0A2A6RFJ6_9CHLR|nr:peptide ABC transporter substrate-binding protein [Candidatus Viridilinea mediisalina]PDW01904.1 ABC transporter substrate-binding protein [Candidatus Viridilinea mediisalina]